MHRRPGGRGVGDNRVVVGVALPGTVPGKLRASGGYAPGPWYRQSRKCPFASKKVSTTMKEPVSTSEA